MNTSISGGKIRVDRSDRGLHKRRGAMLVFVALMLVALMGMVALAIDAGSIQQRKRIIQNAADAGAQAGAQEILRARNDSAIFAAATEETARNGYSNGVNNASVTVTHPTAPDYFTGPSYVKVAIADTVRTFFAGVLGWSKVIVRARAWGGIITPSTYCVVVLAPTGADALLLQTGGDLTAQSCNVAVNSNDPKALENKSSNSELEATTISVVGNYLNQGTISPTPLVGQAPQTDPMAYITMPSFGACDHDAATDNYGDVQTARTLDPGVYCGDDHNEAIWVHGNSAVATLNPGLYVIRGGGFRVSTGGRVIGDAVDGTSFLLTNGYVNVASEYLGVNFETGSHIELAAMKTGNLAGILFYQNPLAGVTNTVYENKFQTDGASTFSGSMYFPTQKVIFRTGSTTTINGGIVAKWMLVETGTDLVVTGNGGGGGGSGYFGLKRGSVVE